VSVADWIAWLSVALWIASGVAIFAGRHWLIARVQRGVQHSFDQKIEQLRSDLRKNEVEFKASLNAKEAEIATLRSQVFSGVAKRNELLNKRRFEAVDNTWAAMKGLASYRLVSEMFLRVNLKEVEADSQNPNLKAFFTRIAAMAPKDVPPNISAHSEQLYLSPLAWSYFSAYQSTVLLHFSMIKALELGLADVRKLVNLDRIREILKAALPKDATWIDECEPTDFALLLGDLEKALMAELKNILDGKAEDEADIDRANRINQAINKMGEPEAGLSIVR